MAAYVIIQVEVTDPTAYAKYMQAANGTHDAFGGRFVARGGAITPLEGDWTPPRFVVIEFPSTEKALGWYRSPGYQAARRLRLGAAKFQAFIVEGLPTSAAPGVTSQSTEAVNLAQRFEMFSDLWSPHKIASVDDYDVKIVKVKGDFVEHVHEHEDELFLVLDGELRLKMPHGEARLRPGELFVVPRGTHHRPTAPEETRIMLLERRGVVNTGNVRNEQTRTEKSI
jgi:uncharacterized protein (DUF1330 family)/mannose-6-phosphate isomerase-like protein (cupin superfamily)